jgi:tryptophan synthase alpha chain
LLKPAIHLYKKYGFKEVPLGSSEYKRSNIKMEIDLRSLTRIEEVFKRKQYNILNVYCTAGFPKLESTLDVMQALQNNGAELIELGMPYSDPLADGPVIQESGARALENGMTISKLFEQLNGMRSVINVPVILMGYMNPVLQYGFEAFCAKAAEVGVDGLILPDLPIYEYETEYGEILKKYNLNLIFLVTPETKEDRIRKIDELSSGFLYAVSSSSTTGSNKEITGQESYFQRLKGMNLKNPILVGFGIKDKQTFDAACKYTNGAIIGSAYIKALSKSSDINATTAAFLKPILGVE